MPVGVATTTAQQAHQQNSFDDDDDVCQLSLLFIRTKTPIPSDDVCRRCTCECDSSPTR